MKYKLIQWYPSLPSSWAIDEMIIEETPFDKNYYQAVDLKRYGDQKIHFSQIHGMDAFWKIINIPLFTTEDGVEIFTGDNYWFVVVSELDIVGPWIPRRHTCDWDYSGEWKRPPLGGKQFSTKKAANDWIKLNKPQYSLQDIQRAFNINGGVCCYNDFIKELNNG